jgi:2-polyprenyl-6-hydroxyphenyl methylase/3-demethylubiquinone-9 3-methyltransferase
MWAVEGDRVHGMDINEKLVEGYGARVSRGQRTSAPDRDAPAVGVGLDGRVSCRALEHVPVGALPTRRCVCSSDGTLYVSTTNWLCPKQQEFELPMYAWYPPALKRHYEKLAVTTRRELVNHAQYPAVHWFSFFGLRRALLARGMRDAWDRFDVMDLESKGGLSRAVVAMIRAIYPLRVLAHVATPYTVVVAVK